MVLDLKEVIQAPDRPGFLVNALLVPYLLAAVRMAEAARLSAVTGKAVQIDAPALLLTEGITS